MLIYLSATEIKISNNNYNIIFAGLINHATDIKFSSKDAASIFVY